MTTPTAGPIRPTDEPALFTPAAGDLVMILEDEPERATRPNPADAPTLF